MEPGIQAPAVRRRGRIGRRHHQPVGLHALIDLRNVAAHHQPGRRGPGGFPLRQLRRALFALLRELLGAVDFRRLEEFVVLQGVAHRLAEDQTSGEQRAAASVYRWRRSNAPARPAIRLRSAAGTSIPIAGIGFDRGLGESRRRAKKKNRQPLHSWLSLSYGFGRGLEVDSTIKSSGGLSKCRQVADSVIGCTPMSLRYP